MQWFNLVNNNSLEHFHPYACYNVWYNTFLMF